MKLDRSTNDDGRGKYGLIKLRRIKELKRTSMLDSKHRVVYNAIRCLENAGLIDWGLSETEQEFFVIRLKDKYAGEALYGYATAAAEDGNHEWADEIFKLMGRAGEDSKWCKKPD